MAESACIQAFDVYCAARTDEYTYTRHEQFIASRVN